MIPPAELKENFPLSFAYFTDCRTRLEEREQKVRKNDKGQTVTGKDGRSKYDRPFAGPNFYRYSRPQNFEVMSVAKILVPAIAQRAEYAIDENGDFFFVGSGGGGGGGHAIIPNIDIDLKYLCGLLNSTLLDAFLQQVTTPFHSGWFAYSKAYIKQIPIKIPRTAADKKLATLITHSVRAIMEAKTALQKPGLSDREKNQLQSTVEANEHRINESVLALYGVDGLPAD